MMAKGQQTEEPSMRVVLMMALVVLATSACSPWWPSEGAESSTAAVTVEPGDLSDGDWYATWEEAALAEAKRLHPELEGLRAERVHIRGVGDRVYVEAEGDFCRVYGGMRLQDRWRANETVSC